MKHKTAELEGALLDAAVAKALGDTPYFGPGKVVGMAVFAGRIYLATEGGVYSMGEGDGGFKPVPIEWACQHKNTRAIEPASIFGETLQCLDFGRRTSGSWKAP